MGLLHTGELDERVRLMKDGLINNSRFLVSAVLGIVVVPIMLNGLRAELYGLWVVALSMIGILGFLDFGLDSVVVREVAGTIENESSAQAARFVKMAATVYFLIGLGGAVTLSIIGLVLSSSLHLSDAARRIAPVVFLLAGVTFLVTVAFNFSLVILRGLRRFDFVNILAVGETTVRTVGIILLIKGGMGLVSVCVWQILSGLFASIAGFLVLARLRTGLSVGLLPFDRAFLRAHLPFGFGSQLAFAAARITWDTGPLLIGLVLGSTWIALYNVAQKFPYALTSMTWSAAEVLFPAVIQYRKDPSVERARNVLKLGTRWITVLAIPLCVILWNAGPQLLYAWVGESRPEAVTILRLFTTAVFVDAMGAASFEVLWGLGLIRTILTTMVAVALSSLGLGWLLLHHIGVTGATWGILLPMTVGAFSLMERASRTCEIRLTRLLRDSFDGLLLPTTAVMLAGLVVNFLLQTDPLLQVLAGVLFGGPAYLICFYLVGAREEEWKLTRDIIRLPLVISKSVQDRMFSSKRHWS
jgi:O-antigen/teichoic acid export membrane protein